MATVDDVVWGVRPPAKSARSQVGVSASDLVETAKGRPNVWGHLEFGHTTTFASVVAQRMRDQGCQAVARGTAVFFRWLDYGGVVR